MRIVRVSHNGRARLGVLEDGGIRIARDGPATDLTCLDELMAGGFDVLRTAHAAMKAGACIPVPDAGFLTPVARPSKIICVGLNYRDHTRESGYEQPDYPTFFPRYASTLIGCGQPIVRPRVSNELDYEGEIVAVIGRPGRDIPRDKALEHVSGYSIFNDVSVRDYQFRTPQWTMGKNFDGTGPMGPEFVSSDELPPGIRGLRIRTFLNDEVVQDANTNDLIFGIDELVSLASEVFTLSPGDLIVSGTPPGVGFARTPPLFMGSGDICAVEVEGLGTLVNPIADEQSAEVHT